MRNSRTKSFANQFGITQKNVTANPSAGMGLNPNLNIEDEYIENLLKQVHFLNMEIKLVKEKQKDNKGLGIMGLLNKDQNPVVTHAVTSNNKFSEMRSTLNHQVNTAQTDYLKLDNQNTAVKAQRDFVEKLSLKEEQENIEHKIYVDKVMTDYRERLSDQLRKLKELREEHRRTTDTYTGVKGNWEDLKTKTDTKNLFKDINGNLEGENEGLRQKHFTAADTKLAQNKNKLDEAYKQYRADPTYVQLVEENTDLKEKLKKTDKELFDMNYRAKEMEELKKLSLKNKDVESELKKQAVEESERMKRKLEDKRAEFDVKFKEAQVALEGNDEVRLVKARLARKDKEINDLKKKTEVSENNYRRLRDEVLKLQTALKSKQEKNKEREEKLNKLKAIQNEENTNLRQCELDHEKADADLTNFQNAMKDTRKRLQSLEEELVYLTAEQEFLNNEIKLDEGIKQVKIEQLTNLMHSNTGLNDTIGSLMEKWQQIIKFSRQPPAPA